MLFLTLILLGTTMPSTNFLKFKRNLLTGNHNFSSDSLKVMLVSSVPSEANLDSWEFRSDVSNEITGTGYTSGGISQPYTLNALDTTLNRQTVTLTNIVNGWTSAVISCAGCIIYKDTGSASTDRLITFVDFNGTVSVNSGNFNITYSSPLILE